ncbi:MAG: hypothetical protein HQK81_08155 [Desulfovibrionaceae bacterium]|nr:hypothetical protein [Desulfovibrionaceae bacterium]MBF0514023.1 hypothetical protein [Desulfovibrionaceae bacterium]
MTLRRLIIALGLLPALALPALAAQLDRRPAVQTVFTGEATCPAATGDTKDSLLSRCFTAARINLLDNAAAAMEKTLGKQNPELARQDYRAVAAGLLAPEIDGKEFAETGGSARAAIKLKAAADPDALAAKIKEIAANPALRRKLAAAQREADAKDTLALALAGSDAAGATGATGLTGENGQEEYADFSRAAAERRKIMGAMETTAASASANIRRGMSDDAVRRILGEPATMKLGTVSGNFICLGYGEVWVILENGLTSCLRSRLEYSKTYESDCHCAGLLSSFIPFATDARGGPAPRKGAPSAGQNNKNSQKP